MRSDGRKSSIRNKPDQEFSFWEDLTRPDLPIPAALTAASSVAVEPRAGSIVCSLLSSWKGASGAAQAAVLRKVASRMRDRNFGLLEFHNDMVLAFPELRLYLSAAGTTSSGNSSTDEYKRTIGAFFAIYWLMRLDLPTVEGSQGLDGQRGFCFGVGADWEAPSELDLVDLQVFLSRLVCSQPRSPQPRTKSRRPGREPNNPKPRTSLTHDSGVTCALSTWVRRRRW